MSKREDNFSSKITSLVYDLGKTNPFPLLLIRKNCTYLAQSWADNDTEPSSNKVLTFIPWLHNKDFVSNPGLEYLHKHLNAPNYKLILLNIYITLQKTWALQTVRAIDRWVFALVWTLLSKWTWRPRVLCTNSTFQKEPFSYSKSSY